nr:hypothetical protein [Kofleriaceae bacterium]
MSRYDLFRKRLAPVAFGLAIVLLARDACNHEQRTHATIVFDLGSDSRARAVDAELFVGGDSIATFHQTAMDNAGVTTAKFEASLPADDGELHIELDLGSAHPRTTRHFHAVDGSTVMVPLAELAH